jgi:hypothetical protein
MAWISEGMAPISVAKTAPIASWGASVVVPAGAATVTVFDSAFQVTPDADITKANQGLSVVVLTDTKNLAPAEDPVSIGGLVTTAYPI